MHFYYLNFNWWSITSDEYKKWIQVQIIVYVKSLRKILQGKKLLYTDWVFSWILLKIKFSISEENSITILKNYFWKKTIIFPVFVILRKKNNCKFSTKGPIIAKIDCHTKSNKNYWSCFMSTKTKVIWT